MRNLHTFSNQSKSNKSQSLSARQISQIDSAKNQKNYPYAQTSLKAEWENEYQTRIMKDSSNIYTQRGRPVSRSKQDFGFQSTPKNRIIGHFASPYKNTQYSQKGTHRYFTCNQLAYLMKNERACIEQIRQTIEADKSHIEKDFAHLKQMLNNIIDDLKLTTFAYIDNQYKYFINQFNKVKTDYVSYCEKKKQFWQDSEGIIQKIDKSSNMLNGPQYPGVVNDKMDNEKLLLSIIDDLRDCKYHKNYQQFQQIQEKCLQPLVVISKIMVNQLKIQSYYKSQVANQSFNRIRKEIQANLNGLYESMDLFVHNFAWEQQNPTYKISNVNNISVKHSSQKQIPNKFMTFKQIEHQNQQIIHPYQPVRDNNKYEKYSSTADSERRCYGDINKLAFNHQKCRKDEPQSKKFMEVNFSKNANTY